MKKKRSLKRGVSLLLCLALVLPLFAGSPAIAAAPKTLQLKQAQNMALSNNTEITKTYNEILLKEIQYTEAVKEIKAKVKNLTSFRWTPLLSFKFPEQLHMSEEYDLNVKPLNLQTEIDILRHQMNTQEYEELAKINKAYLTAYVNQEKAAFTEDRLEAAEEELARNQARLSTGEATQADVDTMQSSVDKLTSDLSQQKRNLQTALEEVSDLIHLDVTSGYKLANPLSDAQIPREDLEDILEHAMENSQTIYEAEMAVSTAKVNMDSYESLMRSQYGSKLNAIETFLNQVRNGEDVDYAAFQLKYNEMLESFDAPWNGSIKILFFRFTKEWFKGEIDGTRYIENDLYALLTACKEYQSAVSELESAEKTLRSDITSSYEAIVTARNAYLDLADTVAENKEDLERLSALNQLGQAEYSEVKTKQEEYQTNQMDLIDALATYNELLYELDSLTCGAISPYLSGTSVSTDVGSGGDSYVTDDAAVPHYYIYTDISDLVFVFGLEIPEDFEPEITDYEIWYSGTQIGERTAVDQQLRHLALDYKGSYTLTVRLYNGDEYVTECEIDTTVMRDVLPIESAQEETTAQEQQCGTYQVDTVSLGSVSTSTLTLSFDATVGAAYYRLESAEGASVYTQEPVPAEESFSYLTLLISSLSTVKLQVYDREQNLIGTARFDEDTQTIWMTAQ